MPDFLQSNFSHLRSKEPKKICISEKSVLSFLITRGQKFLAYTGSFYKTRISEKRIYERFDCISDFIHKKYFIIDFNLNL
jgi:hypothetical protein